MGSCSSCSTELSEGSKYCPQCGVALAAGSRPSEFEIGKIAALAAVKSDVLKWLGVPAAILVGLFSVLGFFGINELVKSAVSDEVRKELTRNQENIDREIQGLYINVGKATQDQEQIGKILSDTQEKLKKTEENRIALSTKVDETEVQKQQLVNITRELNIAKFIT